MVSKGIFALYSFYLVFGKLVAFDSNNLNPAYNLHNARYPPSFDSTNSFGRPLSEISKSPFNREDRLLEKEVTGLSNILKLFDNSHFLIILTSFRGNTFGCINYPVILRSLRVVWLHHLNSNIPVVATRPVFVLEEIFNHKINITKTYFQHFLLSGSRFWTSLGMYLSTINITQYSMKTRPWIKHISILLFPYINPETYSMIDKVYTEVYSGQNTVLATVTPLKILLVSPVEDRSSQELAQFVSLVNIEVKVYARFYVVHAVPSQGRNNFLSENLSVIQVCHWKFETYVNLVSFEDISKIRIDLNMLGETVSPSLCMGDPKFNNLLYSTAPPDKKTSKIISSVWWMLRSCHNQDQQQLVNSEPHHIHSIAKSYANLWLSVVRNVSYFDPTLKYICDNGFPVTSPITSEASNFDFVLQITPTFVQNREQVSTFFAVVSSIVNDLQFVTCAYRGSERLKFMELLNVFDRNVWVLLILAILSLTLILPQIPKFLPQFTNNRSIVVPIKVLLEQGTPFPVSIIKGHGGKWVVGTFLLAPNSLLNPILHFTPW